MKKKLFSVVFTLFISILFYNNSYCQLLPSDKYENVLWHSKFIGSWTVTELQNAPDSIKTMLPFHINEYAPKFLGGEPLIAQPRASIETRYKVIPKKIFDPEWVPDSTPLLRFSLWKDTSFYARAHNAPDIVSVTNIRPRIEGDSLSDARWISIRLKKDHLIQDVADTTGGELDGGKILTTFAGLGDITMLDLYLRAGDSVLIRLLPGSGFTEMPFLINFSNASHSYPDHGRLVFNHPFYGVRNLQNDWSAPSKHLGSKVAVDDTAHTIIWQDSLLYQNFDKNHPGKWRHHHWMVFNRITFENKLTLGPHRQVLIVLDVDSQVHPIVIKTDLGGTGERGVIGFKDPFLVDSTTRNNVNDTLWMKSPFLPHTDSPAGRMPGADPEHSGGVFLKENVRHDSYMPIYTLKAAKILKAKTLKPVDTGKASRGDWVFEKWVSDDVIAPNDCKPWFRNPDPKDLPLINMNPVTDVVFSRDSAQYIARYKRH